MLQGAGLFQAWRADGENDFLYVEDPEEAEPHPQFQLSLKYPFALVHGQVLGPWVRDESLNFGYAGEYDFYLQRYSQPVVSRIQNPGMWINETFRDSGARARGGWISAPWSLDLGWWHESNGQCLSTESQYETFEKYNLDGAHAQDYVSMAWDYFALRMQGGFYQPITSAWTGHASFRFEDRIYDGSAGIASNTEENVFWGNDPRYSLISWYDGLRWNLGYEIGCLEGKGSSPWVRKAGLAVDLRCGNDFGYRGQINAWDLDAIRVSARYSFTLDVRMPWFFAAPAYVPLTAFYFNGWGPYPCDYMDHHELFGAGLSFH